MIKGASVARGEGPGPVRRRRGARRREAREGRGHRRRRAGRPARAWSTCTPTCASRAARTPRPCSPGRGPPRSVASPPCSRWPTPRRSPTPPRRPSGCSTSAGRPAWSTYNRSGRSPAASAGEELAELGLMARSRAKVRVFSDDGKCVHDPRVMRRALEYVRAFGGVISQHSQDPDLAGPTACCHEGELSGRLGLPGLAGHRRGDHRRPRRDARAAHQQPGARRPRLHRRVGRGDPVGQGPGHRRHRRGDAAPPAADHRPAGRLRPGLQGQPAAAPRRGRRRAARRARRRHHRRGRHRPRAARAPRQGARLRRRRLRDARPRDGALGGQRGDGRPPAR